MDAVKLCVTCDWDFSAPATEGGLSAPTLTASESAAVDCWVGSYRLIQRLGEGGLGVVYEAEQQHPRRLVALKMIHGGTFVSARHVKLFEREAQALARLKHPGIASIYESGCTPDGQHFFAMELVHGETLAAWTARRPLTSTAALRERLQLFLRVCEAISYAHQRGVIHRDVKPANIMVTVEAAAAGADATTPAIKVLDFGLARITDADAAVATLMTEGGRLQGTLSYMSPEQARGNPDEIDLRTDVYSLGVTLYELVTGSLPYEVNGVSLLEAANIICDKDPKPIPKTLGIAGGRAIGVSRDLDAIVMKALEKEPHRRYQSAAALGDDVERFLHDEPVSARAQSATYQVRKLIARHKLPVVSAGGIVLLLATFAIAMAVQSTRLARERDRARHEAATSARVTDFLVGLFKVSDPSEARGNSLTAREVLDRGVSRVETELREDPAIQARLQETMGHVYTSLGLYQQARAQLDRALDTRRRQFGDRSLEVAETLYQLGELDRTARPESRDATRLRWSQESLAIRRQFLGNDDLDVAASLRQAAIEVALAGDRNGDAERMLQESLAIRTRRLGDEHVLVADSLEGLGYVISYLKVDFARGEPFLVRALAMRRRLLGNDHPDTLKSIQDLANHFNRMENNARAEPLYREEIAVSKRILGPTHPTIARQMNDLVIVLNHQGRFEEADRVGRDALAIAEGRDPQFEAALLANMAINLASIGDWNRGEQLLRRSLPIYTEQPANGYHVATLAAVDNASGRTREALRLADEAVAKLRSQRPIYLAMALDARATALRNLRPSEAQIVYKENAELLRPIVERLSDAGNPRDLARSRSLLGGALTELEQYEEAEPLLIGGYTLSAKLFGERHWYTRDALERILRLYERWKPEKGAPYRAALAAASPATLSR